MTDSTELTLFYEEVMVGRVSEAFLSDETWYGIFAPTDQPLNARVLSRVSEFVAFCKEWNERLRVDSAEPEEFDQYDDIIKTDKWSVVTEGGDVIQIDGSPVFFEGGDVSWGVKTVRREQFP